jgi:hypothetical protein
MQATSAQLVLCRDWLRGRDTSRLRDCVEFPVEKWVPGRTGGEWRSLGFVAARTLPAAQLIARCAWPQFNVRVRTF